MYTKTNRINQNRTVHDSTDLICKHLKIRFCDRDQHTQHETDPQQKTKLSLLGQTGADMRTHGGHGKISTKAEHTDTKYKHDRTNAECDQFCLRHIK